MQGNRLFALVFAAMLGCSGGDGKGIGDGGNGGDGGGGEDGGGSVCEQLEIGADRGIPNVLIVLDRSNSMTTDNRWNQSIDAIQNVVTNLEDGIAFGLMLFGSGGSVCSMGQVYVEPATGNASDINSTLDTSEPSGGTPTAPSLEVAGDALAELEGTPVILLVTDGAPNCNFGLDKDTCTCTCSSGFCNCDSTSQNCLDDTRTIDTVEGLASDGIKTYVIGFDTEAWGETLDGMAAAGGTGLTEHIPVSDGSGLEDKLLELSGTVVSCSYELEMAPADYKFVRVKLDGVALPHVSQTQGESGWELAGKTITLIGDTCDAVKAADDPQLSISVECEQVLL